MLGVNESAAGNSSRAASKTLCARGILGGGAAQRGNPGGVPQRLLKIL